MTDWDKLATWWGNQLEEKMGMGGDLEQQAMEELAELLEQGKRVSFKTAIVNGFFTVSIRTEPGNPIHDRTFTVREEWLPTQKGTDWVFSASFFQKYSRRHRKNIEDRTLRTLVANLKKNGVTLTRVDTQSDNKVLVALSNGSNFRIDKKWAPVQSQNGTGWHFPAQLFQEHGPEPGSIFDQEILNRGRTPAAGIDLRGSPDAIATLPSGQKVAVDYKTTEKPPMTPEQLAAALGKSAKWVENRLPKPVAEKHGYHSRDIPKGKAGEFSKITEEYHEALDAYESGNPVMLMVELSDLLGAVERFLEVHHPSVSLDNIVTQAKLTNEVFRRGLRPNRDPE